MSEFTKDKVSFSAQIDADIAEKFDCIAKSVARSRAKHIEWLVKREVDYYEQTDPREESLKV